MTYEECRMNKKNFVEHELADMLKAANYYVKTVEYIPDFFTAIDECLRICDKNDNDVFINISANSKLAIVECAIKYLLDGCCQGMLNPIYEFDRKAIENYREDHR